MRASDAIGLAAAALLLGVLPAHAQTQRAPGNNAASAAAAQQAAAAQAELAGVKQQLADLQKELAGVKAERDGLNAKVVAATNDRQKDAQRADSAAHETETVRETLATTQRQLAEKVAALRAAEGRGADLEGQLGRASSAYSSCLATNSELVGLTTEAVGRYEKVESIGRREPFTRLATIRAQNIADETRAAVAKLAIKPPTAEH